MSSPYRRYIRDYALIARPLHQLTKKGLELKWTPECEVAFKTIKQALVSRSLVAYPRRDESFILDSDASGWAIGAVLSQVQTTPPNDSRRERVVAYGS